MSPSRSLSFSVVAISSSSAPSTPALIASLMSDDIEVASRIFSVSDSQVALPRSTFLIADLIPFMYSLTASRFVAASRNCLSMLLTISPLTITSPILPPSTDLLIFCISVSFTLAASRSFRIPSRSSPLARFHWSVSRCTSFSWAIMLSAA